MSYENTCPRASRTSDSQAACPAGNRRTHFFCEARKMAAKGGSSLQSSASSMPQDLGGEYRALHGRDSVSWKNTGVESDLGAEKDG